LTVFRTPWETGPAPTEALLPGPTPPSKPKPRGRRWVLPQAGPARGFPAWLYHRLTITRLTITGPAGVVAEFAAAARGSGVVPWQIDSAALEEDVFNLAAAQPPAQRSLSIEGCRILARQFRDRVEARQARAAALIGRSQACPFDLHAMLPVPAAILQQGPMHPASLAWLRDHWGISDGLRHIVELADPRPGRRLSRNHAVLGYGFFTGDDTPRAAIAQLAARWTALRFVLQPRPD